MKLQNYSHKPKTRFFGKGPWYIGMELEVEAPDREKMEAGLQLRNKPSAICAKRDGSLGSYGWELVTQPISPEIWLAPKHRKVNRKPGSSTGGAEHGNAAGKLYAVVASLRDLGYTSYDGGRCGLHFHVSRTAFGAEPYHAGEEREPSGGWRLSTHLYFFRRLVHGELFAQLSQRDSYGYCQRKMVEVVSRDYRQAGRYEAVNITDKTVEVRIFRGNTREDRIKAAVEAVIAAVEFTKTLPDASRSADELDATYVQYVRDHAKTYPNLAARLTELGR